MSLENEKENKNNHNGLKSKDEEILNSNDYFQQGKIGQGCNISTSNQKNFQKLENNNKNYYHQENYSKRNNNNNSNLESTFNQTYRANINKYDSENSGSFGDFIIINNNSNISNGDKKDLNSVQKSENISRTITYFNYSKNDNNKDYKQIYKNEKKEEQKDKKNTNQIVNNYIEQIFFVKLTNNNKTTKKRK